MEGVGKNILEEDIYRIKNTASDVRTHCIYPNLLQKKRVESVVSIL